jgi:hypothetical protein
LCFLGHRFIPTLISDSSMHRLVNKVFRTTWTF